MRRGWHDVLPCVLQWQKERRAERRAKEKVQREERLQSMFAALRAKIEGKARDMAMQYLKSKDGQVWIKMEKYPVRLPRLLLASASVVRGWLRGGWRMRALW